MPSPTPAMHRADIQGLRGIAVLLVVLYHSEVGFSGGFIGVDVFFVISGFVITQLLVRELDGSGTVGLRTFYTRRARRLLPALAVMSAVVLVLSVFLLSPNGPQQFAARTSLSADFFVANVYLWRTLSNYFAEGALTNPFLHLWTLSVEEQFYLVLPATLLVLWRVGRRWSRRVRVRLLVVVVGVASVVSLAASALMVDFDRTLVWISDPVRFAFYLMPTRLWEFGVGVLLALVPGLVRRVPALVGAAAAVVGGVLVLGTALAYDGTTSFPGLHAVPPVLGGALLLVGGAQCPIAARTLGVGPLTWIGDRSYSWYLWHWPMIVLARVTWPGSGAALAIAAAGSLLPAWAAYEWVENPIRRNRDIRGWSILRLAGACVAVPAVLALGLGFGGRHGWWNDDLVAVVDRSEARRAGCHTESFQAVTWSAEACTFPVPDGPSHGTMLLVGDSHAIAASDGIAAAAHALGYDLAVWSRASCPFVVDPPTDRETCGSWNAQALALVESMQPAVVVIAQKTANHVANEPEGEAGWEAHVRARVQELADRGASTLILGDVPEYAYDGTATVSLLRPHGRPPTLDRAEVDADEAAALAAEERAVDGLPASVLDTVPYLCGTDTCSPVDDDQWLYYDTHHLTPEGSMRLVQPVTEALQQLLSEASTGSGGGA